MAEDFLDLQVVPGAQRSSSRPQTLPSNRVRYSDKIVIPNQPTLLPTDMWLSQQSDKPEHGRRICRLTTKACWILATVVAVIIVVAAIGGGVGGSMATKKNNMDGNANFGSMIHGSTSTIAAPVTSPTLHATTGTSTISISTFTTRSPTATLLVDCPSSNDTLYTPPSTSQIFRKVCYRTYIGDTAINRVNQPTSSLDDCIRLCATYNVQNATQIANGAANICNAVCWRATIQNDDWPGQCFGFTTTNSSGNFVYNNDPRCNGAALINQSFL